MRTLALAVTASLLAAVAAPQAVAACYENDQPIEGALEAVAVRTSTGRNATGYSLSLARPVCVTATDYDGVPTRIERVRAVQILATDRAGELALARLVGSRITVLGHFDVPDRSRHTGDAVLSNAELVAVEGADAGEGADGGGSDADAGQSGAYGEDYAADTEAQTGFGTQTSEEDTGLASGASDYREANKRKKMAEQRGLEERIVAFIGRYYLGSGEMSIEEMRAVYASKVDYYGKRGVPFSRVLKDKVAYDKRWPDRRFDLVPGTMEVRRLGWDGRIYDISYVYDFYVSAPGRARSGRGYARLTLDLGAEGGKIVREAGKVIMRD